MRIKKFLTGMFVVPALMICVCSCNKNDETKDVVYSEVSKGETVAFLAQVKEAGAFDIDGYEFNVTMSVYIDFDGAGGEGGSEGEEFAWPDTSDTTKWENVKLSGVFTTNDEYKAKYSIESSEDNCDIYIKNNVIYSNDGTNKYKATFDSFEEIEELEMAAQLPDVDQLLEQVEMIYSAEEGLKFEKGHLDGRDYYHVSGVAVINENEGGFSLDMEMPIDLYLTFENNTLVSYKYKTMFFIMIMEFEVEAYSGEIEFPEDLDTYIENKDAFIEE